MNDLNTWTENDETRAAPARSTASTSTTSKQLAYLQMKHKAKPCVGLDGQPEAKADFETISYSLTDWLTHLACTADKSSCNGMVQSKTCYPVSQSGRQAESAVAWSRNWRLALVVAERTVLLTALNHSDRQTVSQSKTRCIEAFEGLEKRRAGCMHAFVCGRFARMQVGTAIVRLCIL